MKKTNKISTQKPGKSYSMACISACTTALLGSSVSACSDGEQENPYLTATQVCDFTLDAAAARVLERMGATKKFGENYRDSTENYKDNPESFTLARTAQMLHADITQRNSCYVYKADTGTGYPLIHVDFFATDRYTKPDPSPKKRDPGDKFYSLGLYAKTQGTEGAALYFKCSTRGGGKETPYVKATLYSTPGETSPKATGQDLMTILGTMSRALAGQLGCAAEAALPAQITEADQPSG